MLSLRERSIKGISRKEQNSLEGMIEYICIGYNEKLLKINVYLCDVNVLCFLDCW